LHLTGYEYQISSTGLLGSNPLLIGAVVVFVVVAIALVLRQNLKSKALKRPRDNTAQTQTQPRPAQQQPFCLYCGSKILPTAVFCDVCGRVQQQPNVRPIRINSLLGMTTLDATGKVVGAVSDVEFSEGHTYLIIKPIQGPGASERAGAIDMIVRWDQIASIQDIIMLKIRSTSKAQICSCGYENMPGAKFCRSCGRALD
jgi:sporulation protein YlmC with PRC-barrel domain